MTQNFETLAIIIPVAIAAYGVLYKTYKNRHPAPLPPGPKGLPLVGNVADLPKSQPWITYSKWGDIYGDIVHVNAMGTSMIILNDYNVAVEVLEKKGKIYSDRPTFTLSGSLVGWDETPGLLQLDRNGPWSEFRKHYTHYMGSRGKVVESFSDPLQTGARKFIKNLLDRPDEWSDHIRLYAASTVLLLAYGYELQRADDELLSIVSEAMEEFSELSLSSSYLVDVFPILRYIPSWFPGAGWKRKIPMYQHSLNKMIDAPYEWAERQFNAGIEIPSFVYNSIANKEEFTPEQKRQLKVVASSIFAGGSETSFAGIQSFFLAMTLYQSVQAKAQAEIDKVIGQGRLPTLEDRPNLPYVEALYWEVLRCYIFTPLSIPHVAHEDDIHNGYFIPKGSVIVPNAWRFTKNPKTYRNPDIFSPDRFLASEGNVPEQDPRTYIFGFGRRICPGRHMGDASMWLAMASVLASFALRPMEKDGKPVPVNPTFKEGTVLYPVSFECDIKPRTAALGKTYSQI